MIDIVGVRLPDFEGTISMIRLPCLCNAASAPGVRTLAMELLRTSIAFAPVSLISWLHSDA